jgi:hypothetical protein
MLYRHNEQYLKDIIEMAEKLLDNSSFAASDSHTFIDEAYVALECVIEDQGGI